MIPVLDAVCDEPNGAVTRSVYPLQLTEQSLRILWEKSKKFKYLLDRPHIDEFENFCKLFMADGPDGIQSTGLFWIVDDFVGLFYMTNIVPGVDAKVHYTFFDRRHRGRIELTKEMIKYVFRKYNFRRLTVEIPLYMAQHSNDPLKINAFSFVESVGFVREGRRRKGILYDGTWFDMAVFGILKEEALQWE